MKKIRWKTLLAVFCVLLAAGLLILLMTAKPPVDPAPSESREETECATEPAKNEKDDAPQPEAPSAHVVIEPVSHPEREEKIISFPCRVPEYGLVLEKLAPYSGTFVEDGTNRSVDEVAMLLVKNQGSIPVEYATIRLGYGEKTLEFTLSALPGGESVLVQEKNGGALPDTDPRSADATVITRPELEMNRHRVRIKDNGDASLTVTNTGDEPLESVRIFYKYYKENVFVGGITFNVALKDLAPEKSITVQPAHFTSDASRVVMVQIDET